VVGWGNIKKHEQSKKGIKYDLPPTFNNNNQERNKIK
jgi:hypothetical protein